MTIGERIKQLRQGEGLTQEALAKTLKISRSALAHYETGSRDVPNYLVPQIAKFFDVTTDHLFGVEK